LMILFNIKNVREVTYIYRGPNRLTPWFVILMKKKRQKINLLPFYFVQFSIISNRLL
jgi:hypothetical protein